MASTAAAAASNLWLGGFAATVRGTWQAVAAGHGDTGASHQQLQQKKKTAAVQGAAAAGGKAAAEDVGRCGGAMSDTTVYLLLDRFAPS